MLILDEAADAADAAAAVEIEMGPADNPPRLPRAEFE
jgi:hypothetical protein